jgi:hypothetical protein
MFDVHDHVGTTTGGGRSVVSIHDSRDHKGMSSVPWTPTKGTQPHSNQIGSDDVWCAGLGDRKRGSYSIRYDGSQIQIPNTHIDSYRSSPWTAGRNNCNGLPASAASSVYSCCPSAGRNHTGHSSRSVHTTQHSMTEHANARRTVYNQSLHKGTLRVEAEDTWGMWMCQILQLYRLNTTEPNNATITVYIGRVTGWAFCVGAVGTLVATILAATGHSLSPSQAPLTLPVVSEATNFEPARTIVNVFIMMTAATSILSVVLWYFKLLSVLCTGTRHAILQTWQTQEDAICNHGRTASIGLLSAVITLSSIMVPLARYPLLHNIGVSTGFTGFTIWSWKSYNMLVYVLPRHLDEYQLRGLVGLHLDTTDRQRRWMFITLIVMTLIVLVGGVAHMMQLVLHDSTTRDVFFFMVLPISEYIYLLTVTAYVATLSWSYRNSIITIPTYTIACH